ncbi:serine/threonine-protein phosphatase 6 regulatory ankyrin repeat subunit B isoform X1 [Histomonas meleagridis]|uniref:serine/threonine-protein phosphatase 6 regulatory ankyrin repeat subunit B isoform X1 n=1 Tax=Histomonas meleagridis TaxID=135588 RepID=UPI0035599A11|nr:serine/threonine-protein phosphatase 6 regulatory ankyrin repeat subunit B isoform X1 [Histomonas meleagridis]KAH0801299.1 serine/threonine-protein phosphatase 6 regulatory ankyrin repeat subunit B isoform X1 [Histomonas meleagridis]
MEGPGEPNLADLKTIPETGASAIHYWASSNDLDSLILVLVNGGEKAMLIADNYGNSVLHYAAWASAKEVSQFVVNHFPKTHFQNIRKITPAHIAAQRGDIPLLRIYQTSLTIFNDVTAKGWSPLHFAIYYGQTDAVHFLLENKINSVDDLILGSESNTFLNHRRLKFTSPYDLALISNHQEIAELLSQYGALPSLHSAVLLQNLLAVTYLVESFQSNSSKNLNLTAGPKNHTALHVAASKGYYAICHYLILSGLSTDQLDTDGLSPLEIAVTSKSTKTVETIQTFASQEQITKAAFLAADLGNSQIAFKLAKGISSLSYNHEDGDSLLIHLIKRNLFEEALIIVQAQKCDIKLKDLRGATALHYAAASGHSLLLRDTLSQSKLAINDKDNNGMTPLMYAVLAGSTEMINSLKHSDNNATCNCGITPFSLSYSLDLGNVLVIKNSKNKLTIDFGKAKTLFKNHKLQPKQISFLKFKCPTLNLIDHRFDKFIHSLQFFDDEIVEDVTVLHLAAIGGSKSIIKIIEQNREFLDATDSFGRTPLHYAAISNNYSSAEVLNSEMLNINQKDKKGNTILHYLLHDSMLPVVKKILKNTSLSLIDKNNDDDTPFHLLCKTGAIQILTLYLRTLEANNRDVLDSVDKFGKTPIMYALENNHQNCLSSLHSYGVINYLTKYVNENDFDSIKNLVENGHTVNSNDAKGMTPLHYASIKGDTKIIKYLIDHKADLKAQDSQGMYPLHYAAKSNNIEAIKMLLSLPFKIIDLKLKEQPFVLCTDQKCKEFLTPAGRFEIYLEIEDKTMYNFITTIGLRNMRINSGKSCFQKNNNRVFQCLVNYSVSRNYLSTKMLIIKAGEVDECEDICRNHLMESLGSPIAFISVMARDVTTDEDLIII